MNIALSPVEKTLDEVVFHDDILAKYQRERDIYGSLLDAAERAYMACRVRLSDRRVWHINSTAFGGGVAEMLPHHIALMRGFGIDMRWLIFKPRDKQFFVFTKGLHNSLHNVQTPCTDELVASYERESRQGARDLRRIIGADDVVIVHDPQPLAAASFFLESQPHPAIWRCHIGYPQRAPTVDRTWEFLRGYLRPFHRVVLSDADYAFNGISDIDIIPPSISPFADKNLSYPDEPGDELERYVSINGYDEDLRISLADLIKERYFLQVSRWDRLKGIDRVLEAFRRFVENESSVADGTRLVIAGPDPAGVSDDPEAAEYLSECEAHAARLPRKVRQHIRFVCVSMKDHQKNAEIISRLQARAFAVFQLSKEEGFGLALTEALFKCRPVVVSDAFGLKRQIIDGVNGIVIQEPGIEEKASEIMRRLVVGTIARQRLGRTAGQMCIQNSVQIAHAPSWLESIANGIAQSEGCR
ncbi:glycosyltransferase [Bradyrhizobium sp. Arg314]